MRKLNITIFNVFFECMVNRQYEKWTCIRLIKYLKKNVERWYIKQVYTSIFFLFFTDYQFFLFHILILYSFKVNIG